jgi:hypothetical protein
MVELMLLVLIIRRANPTSIFAFINAVNAKMSAFETEIFRWRPPTWR